MWIMFTKIKEYCFTISTLGAIGQFRLGGLIGSLFAIPLLYFFRMVWHIKPNLYFALFALTILFFIGTIHLALRFPSHKDPSSIVLDKLFGYFLVFIGIPLTLKLFIVGFFLFHFVNLIRPFVLHKIWNINIENLPGVLGIMTGDIITGVAINVFFRIVLWLAA